MGDGDMVCEEVMWRCVCVYVIVEWVMVIWCVGR